MGSLYGRLFTYRERADRRPVEDFLTEALSDLLNRVPRQKSIEFVEELLLPTSDAARTAWRCYLDRVGPAVKLAWSTQRSTSDRKRIDLLLEGDERKLLVVESKIYSALRRHSIARSGEAEDEEVTADTAGAQRNQLATYGRWLAAELAMEDANDGWEGALTLLTHACLPPADFGKGDKQVYGVPWQQSCRWHDVWRWLKVQSSPVDAGESTPAWRELAKELANFLKEQGMTLETMTMHDLALAGAYFESARRIDGTFLRIAEKIQPFLSAVANRIKYLEYQDENCIINGVGYLNKAFGQTTKNNYFFTWGFQFPSDSDLWVSLEPPLSMAVHLFVSFASNDKTIPLAFGAVGTENPPKHWRRIGEGLELVTFCPVHAVPSLNGGMTDAIADWIASRLTELKPVLKLLTRVSDAEPV